MKISHVVISTVFLVITLASTLKISGTLGYYAIFTNDFIENFCENKDRPELHCDGKCALSQMLSQENLDNKDPINLDFLKIETVLFLDSVFKLDFFIPYNSTSHFDLCYNNNYHLDLVDRITHPPRI